MSELKIAFHPAYIHPLPEGHRFPMQKYQLLHDRLLEEGVVSANNFFIPDLADRESLILAHDTDYVDALLDLSIDAKMVRRIGFALSKQLVERELYLTQGTIDGTLHAMQTGVAFNIAGGTHHAGFDFGEGFCLLNDQAVAAANLVANHAVTKVLVIDLDVHQGNGTANIFKDRPEVFTFSMHGEKNFPFVKEQSSLDVGLEDDVSDKEYLNILHDHLRSLFNTVRPEFVFYQSGVDILASDKLGKLGLSKETCQERDELVFSYCRQYQVPVQVSMGGGYSPNIEDIVEAHLATYQTAIEIFV